MRVERVVRAFQITSITYLFIDSRMKMEGLREEGGGDGILCVSIL